MIANSIACVAIVSNRFIEREREQKQKKGGRGRGWGRGEEETLARITSRTVLATKKILFIKLR